MRARPRAGLERGSALTTSLLDFARSRPGHPVRLDLEPVVRGFLPILERLAEPSIALGGGTGLGLASVSAIVHTHGGVVDVTSEPGKGAGSGSSCRWSGRRRAGSPAGSGGRSRERRAGNVRVGASRHPSAT